jgi:hypothetical protein
MYIHQANEWWQPHKIYLSPHKEVYDALQARAGNFKRKNRNLEALTSSSTNLS